MRDVKYKMKYQNYSHYKLPITSNPLEYGKLIEQIGNKYVIQLNSSSITANIIILKQIDRDNYIKFFRRGELMFEFKDHKIDENTFIRTISDQKFTFKDNILIKSEILLGNQYIIIFENINPLYSKTRNFSTSAKQINRQFYCTLPISMNPLDFGYLIYEHKFSGYTEYLLQDNKENSSRFFKIKKFDNHNEVEKLIMGHVANKFSDTYISENKFVRKLSYGKKFYFENNKEIIVTNENKKFYKSAYLYHPNEIE
jgi:hypothetical protein